MSRHVTFSIFFLFRPLLSLTWAFSIIVFSTLLACGVVSTASLPSHVFRLACCFSVERDVRLGWWAMDDGTIAIRIQPYKLRTSFCRVGFFFFFLVAGAADVWWSCLLL